MKLPSPTPTAEDAFVARWRDNNEPTTALIEATEDALSAGRVRLATRLGQVLQSRPDGVGHTVLAQALRGSRLRLLEKQYEHYERSDHRDLKRRFRERQRVTLGRSDGLERRGRHGSGKRRGPSRR